jgi:hypothetical protein
MPMQNQTLFSKRKSRVPSFPFPRCKREVILLCVLSIRRAAQQNNSSEMTALSHCISNAPRASAQSAWTLINKCQERQFIVAQIYAGRIYLYDIEESELLLDYGVN